MTGEENGLAYTHNTQALGARNMVQLYSHRATGTLGHEGASGSLDKLTLNIEGSMEFSQVWANLIASANTQAYVQGPCRTFGHQARHRRSTTMVRHFQD